MVNGPTQTPRNTDPMELRRTLDMMDFFAGMAEAEILRETRSRNRGALLPVLLIGGFLGAGKTTLMRRLLKQPEGRKLLAIVNDVAEINIDAQLIMNTGPDTIALANGCVCCSRSGELARILAELAQTGERPDAIVVETSGVSDLWALAQIVARIEGCILDGVVTLVDAANPPDGTGHELLNRQIAAADLIILNKTDIATPQQVAQAQSLVKNVRNNATIIQTAECSVPTSVLLGFMRSGEHLHHLPHENAHTHFDESFCTLSFRSTRPIERGRLELALNNLPCPVLRIKGIIRFDDNPGEVQTLHQVGLRRRILTEQIPCSSSQLVIIGTRKGWNSEALSKHLSAVGLETG